MRILFALTLLAGVVGMAAAQDPVPPRYGVAVRPGAYPQANPKQALGSAVAAAEARDYAYLAAHLLDPAFVDTRVADRAMQYEPAAEDELAKRRAAQKDDLTLPPAARIPNDPTAFRALARDRAVRLAFDQLVRDLEDKLRDDTEGLKDLRRIARDGVFADAETTSKAEHPTVKGRAVYLKKVGERWFVENRQAEDAPAKKE